MAEWKDVIHQIVRICKLQKGACGTCVLSEESCPNSVRFDLSDEAGFANIEKAIMSWAAENPEPMYPTFGEWLEKQGVVKLVDSDRYEEDGRKVYMLLESVENQIPADIAQKLGLESKEG